MMGHLPYFADQNATKFVRMIYDRIIFMLERDRISSHTGSHINELFKKMMNMQNVKNISNVVLKSFSTLVIFKESDSLVI